MISGNSHLHIGLLIVGTACQIVLLMLILLTYLSRN